MSQRSFIQPREGTSVRARYIMMRGMWLERQKALRKWGFQSTTYSPSPAKRVWIPKPNGKQRGLAIPTLKDRTVQTAAVLILQPIFEQDFEPNSYGFREGKSTHDAVREVVKWLNFGYENVIDADIASCFDTIPKSLLMKQVARRVVDGSVLHLVKQWLHSGILDGGVVVDSSDGTPQGSPISPLLANIFLDDQKSKCACRTIHQLECPKLDIQNRLQSLVPVSYGDFSNAGRISQVLLGLILVLKDARDVKSCSGKTHGTLTCRV